ncbi:tail fiber protein [Oxalobacteraceae bacterium OTU3CINTB1]|nr:tail fiber protein [Oxalobacteraceae bacterium OTU3CINTB1]
MSDPFIAEIRMFSGNFAPSGWALCNGQFLPISQNTALFALLGTAYGGDGKNNFALPDLRQRLPLGTGDGPGLTPRDLGERSGSASVSLQTPQLPSHGHQLRATSQAATSTSPAGNLPAGVSSPTPPYRAPSNLAPMAANPLSVAGGGQPHNNLQPYLEVNFIIATQGIFPARW